MKKTYFIPEAVIIAISVKENILLAGSADTTGPESINDEYTDAPALSNRRLNDIWEDED